MKILFVWTGVTGYMADCWRHLRQLPEVELKVVVELADSGKAYDASQTLSGVDCEIVSKEPSGSSAVFSKLSSWQPDVIFAGGWRSPATRLMLERFPAVPKVFCLDMPWRWQLRCIVARFVLWRFLRKFDIAFVPGKKSSFYARWLGFPKRAVRERLYSVDVELLHQEALKCGHGNRRGFLYVGRYSSEKRVDLIEKAYAEYRSLGGKWELDSYGQGGKFVQPCEMPRVYGEHACLLLASSFDPWPLVMLEAKASGMEVIASDRCGNCDELGAVKVPYGDVSAMAQAMLRIEQNRNAPKSGPTDVSIYNCNAWAHRVVGICRELTRGRFFCPGDGQKTNGMSVVAHALSEDSALAKEFIVHGAWLPKVWLSCLRCILARRGFVRMPHGSFSPVYLKGRFRKRLLRPVERFFLRKADRVLVTCQAEKEWVEAYENKAKTAVIDLRRFDWSRPEGRTQPPRFRPLSSLRVLYMGRRHPLKGLQYLERALERLNDPTDGGKRRTYELKVATGLFGEDKESAFDWCDVVCLPTLSENFGIVIAEALARGKPVITTDGAPAWADEPRRNNDGSERLVVLEGYCASSEEKRVEMLVEALSAFA